MAIFEYGEVELGYLRERDEKLAQVINRVGMIEREVVPDLFTALMKSIVGQQISTKAAHTVWKRMQENFGELKPTIIEKAMIDDIQRCGISARKANYIKGIAEAVMEERILLDEFPNMSDQEIIKTLTSLHGVGVWTAEMLLIFSMKRKDVISWGDLAIRRGISAGCTNWKI